MAKRILLSLTMVYLLCASLHAQEKTVDLPQVAVSAVAIKTEKSKSLDSLISLSGVQTITELLAGNPEMYIKNYGPGGVATISFRGTAASHTAVAWKGIPINNSMLGQSDLSLISGPVLEGASVTTGGRSQSGISENFGGIISLGNRKKWTQNETSIGMGLGSFGNQQYWISTRQKIRKAEVDLAIWNQLGKNNFSYRFENELKRQTHSERNQKGIQASVLIPFHSSWTFETSAWLQKNTREIGPSIYQSLSEAKQNDENLRFCNSLKYTKNELNLELGYGHTQDRLVYLDPLSAIDSRSKILTQHIWFNQSKALNQWNIRSFLRFSDAASQTGNYNGNKNLLRISGGLGAEYQLSSFPIVFSGQIQSEYYRYSGNKNQSPQYLPSLSTIYKTKRAGTWSAGWHSKIRIPTLNDLFWQDLGNPNLKPETGWTADLNWEKACKLSSVFKLKWKTSFYTSLIDNYIQWLPNGAIWTPQNVARVRITGFTINPEIEYAIRKLKLKLEAGFNYNQSIQTKARFDGDESAGKQLIYVPLHQANLTLSASFQKFEFSIWNESTGNRFTTSDNEMSLPAFNILSSRIKYDFQLRQFLEIKVFTEVNNITGTSYQMISGFAMPLQQFKIGLQLKFNNK